MKELGILPYTDVEVVEIDGKAYALMGWNGECYIKAREIRNYSIFENRKNGWKEVLGDPGEQVEATPIYQFEVEGIWDADGLPEEELDRLNQIVGYEIR